MYSTLMVHLELEQDHTALLGIAGGLAERFDAAVVGVVACQPLTAIVGEGFLSGEIIERDRVEKDAQIDAQEKAFRAALQHRTRSLEWRSRLAYDAPVDYIAEQMRSADLLISGINYNGSWPGASWNTNTADLIMQVGRPVLVVPEHTDSLTAKNILVGWKDTREARRAVSDALPFLKTADRVVVAEIVAGDDGLDAAHSNTQDVCTWLARHDIAAEPLALAADDKHVVSLDAIAQKQGADLIVAGAYGHSRLHEWVFGGVTRELLLRSERCSLLSR